MPVSTMLRYKPVFGLATITVDIAQGVYVGCQPTLTDMLENLTKHCSHKTLSDKFEKISMDDSLLVILLKKSVL